MLRWIKHSWIEEHPDSESGPMPSLIDEYENQAAVEVVNGRASVIVVLGHHQYHVRGEGVVDIEEVQKAQAWIDALGKLRHELDASQTAHEWAMAEWDLIKPMMELEDRLMCESAELSASGLQNHIWKSGDFNLLDTRLDGRQCTMVWDSADKDVLLGVVRCNDKGRWAMLDVTHIVTDCDFEYWHASMDEALAALRSSMRARDVRDVSNVVKEMLVK